MFERKIPLFSLFGFKVGIDITWFILAVLITWSLAEGAFPYFFPGMSRTTYWWMGAAGAVGLFFSIVFHEFCHSLVARQFNLPMKGITLFIFGGIAEMDKEPENAKSEFFMAIVGPLSSVFLAGIFFLAYLGAKAVNFPESVNSVMRYLGWLNVLLAVFNMIPAFPLDGGRVLRSILWGIKGDLHWATKVASSLGSGFGIFLMVLGVISFIAGNFIGGLWYFLIGMFIRGASQMSYRQMLIKNTLTGESIRRFMVTDVITVGPGITVSDMIEEYFYKYHHKMFPVVEDGHLEGCVTTRQIKELPRSKWSETKIGEIFQPCSDKNTISPDADAAEALSIMNSTGNSRLMVVKEDNLIGVISLKDLMKFMSLKLDIEAGQKVDNEKIDMNKVQVKD